MKYPQMIRLQALTRSHGMYVVGPSFDVEKVLWASGGRYYIVGPSPTGDKNQYIVLISGRLYLATQEPHAFCC